MPFSLLSFLQFTLRIEPSQKCFLQLQFKCGLLIPVYPLISRIVIVYCESITRFKKKLFIVIFLTEIRGKK